MIIDTHIHLDDTRYADDMEAVLDAAEAAGVQRYIIPGADPETLARAVELAERYEHIYFAAGVHPYDMEAADALEYARYMEHPKCVAVGECGLDYYRLEGSDEEKEREKVQQAEVFRAQIRIAKQYKKPLIVHIREASLDAKRILLEEEAGEVGGVLHCYNANRELLSLAKEGFYFGIGGVLTFNNARKLVEVLPDIPRDKLLLETDGPYLTPHPFRGKRNEPKHCVLVAEKMAELLGEEVQSIADVTTQNARKLFNIP